MSIALSARIKELERQVAELTELARYMDKRLIEAERLEARIQALENRPKPGRPPKHG